MATTSSGTSSGPPSSSAAAASLTSDELGSAAQRDRRRRILDATVDLAQTGGFEAVQMRAVAERADVALGTLYRYFPSKIHLLVSALAVRFEGMQAALAKRADTSGTPSDRVIAVLDRATQGMQREPKLTEALTRAFMFADSSAAAEIDVVGMQLTSMLMRAIKGADYVEGEPPTEDDLALSRVISDVWLSSLVSWVTGRATTDDVRTSMNKAIHLLLR